MLILTPTPNEIAMEHIHLFIKNDNINNSFSTAIDFKYHPFMMT